jgi:hypothetical protein
VTASSKYGAYGLGDYAVFHRFGGATTTTVNSAGKTRQDETAGGGNAAAAGVLLTAQNPYLALTTDPDGATTLSYGKETRLKMIILPRQARDKHRENSKQRRISAAPLMLFSLDKAESFVIDAGLIGLTQLTGSILLLLLLLLPNVFFAPCYGLSETDGLPRHVRDKHREN